MKSKLLFIITFFILSTLLIKAQSEEDIIEATSNEKYWKRHFFDLCLVGALSFTFYSEHQREEGTDSLSTSYGVGGTIGVSFGYQYAFTDKFAFGPGFSGFLFISGNGSYEDIYYNNEHHIFYHTSTPVLYPYYNNYTLMFMFMFGDLKNNKIAVLLDIGGGYLFSAKLGFYVKGFVVKTGYALSGISFNPDNLTFAHNLTFDFGYKFNWKRKIKQSSINK